jgi:hypothetical protein
MRRSSPDSTSVRSPDSPDRQVRLIPRTGSRDSRRNSFDAVVAAFVAACRAKIRSAQTVEFYHRSTGPSREPAVTSRGSAMSPRPAQPSPRGLEPAPLGPSVIATADSDTCRHVAPPVVFKGAAGRLWQPG